MAFRHIISRSYRTDAGSVSAVSKSYTGNAEVNADVSVAPNTTNEAIPLGVPSADIVSLVLYSDQALTGKTNTTATGTNTHRFLIYYGIPVSVNGTGTANAAAAVFAAYDTVVFGDGLEDTGHSAHTSTVSVITAMKALKPSIKVYGYIDLGVTTQNNSIPTITTKIGQWQTTGATGIFFDDAGYDFHTDRARQNSAIDAAHSASMPVIMNAFTAADVCDPAVDATYNAGGVATHLTTGDGYLVESWVVNSVAYSGTGGWETNSDIKVRADAAQTYRAALGIKIYAEGSVDWTAVSAGTQAQYFAELEALSAIYSWDGYGLNTYQFSSASPNADVVRGQPYSLTYDSVYSPGASYSYNSGTATYTRSPITVVLGTHAVTFTSGNLLTWTAGQQITWASDDGTTNPFTLDAATLYVTNSSSTTAATLKLRILLLLP